MYFETKNEVEEACFCVVDTLRNMLKKINGEQERRMSPYEIIMGAYPCRYFDDFATRVAKSTAKKILDDSFSVEDDHSVDNLWIDTAIEETNELLKDISLLGYTFSIKKEYREFIVGEFYLYLVSQDGREMEIDGLEYIDSTVRRFIAEDVLHIATGRILKRKHIFTVDEKDEAREIRMTEEIISEIASCIGEEISYDEVRSTLANKKAEQKVYQLCTEICKEIEETYDSWAC